MSVECEPRWLLAEEAFPELEQQARSRAGEFLGSTVMNAHVSIETVDDRCNDATLLAAIQTGALGDMQSLRVVRNNVRTDVAERLFKAGHQTEVELSFSHGFLSQEGRRLSDIHKNTLEHMPLNSVMRRRTEAELKNALLFEELIGYGVLDEYDVVVLSPTPRDEQTRKDYRFFTDTDSVSMQYLKGNNDKFVMETAMVAGKTRPDAPRRDMEAISRLTAENGIKLSGLDADEVSQVMLVPKTPSSGVHDVVRLFDDALGGTFYGQAMPRQDYMAYREVCRERSASFDSLVNQVVVQLLSEAHTFSTPLDAVERLDELSELYCVRRATVDTSIEARVFGAEAAHHIDNARRYMAQGDEEKAMEALDRAEATADSSSCPFFKAEKSESEKEKAEAKLMNCPHCKSKVYDDPCAKVLVCGDCRAKVIHGVQYKGNGGSKQRMQEKKKRQAALLGQRKTESFVS